MCIYGVDVLYVNVTVVMCIKRYRGVSWCVVKQVLSVSRVFPVCCDGVVVMSSRSSCSHVHTVLSTRPLGVVKFGVVDALKCSRFAIDGVQSPVYGHPFILPLW